MKVEIERRYSRKYILKEENAEVNFVSFCFVLFRFVSFGHVSFHFISFHLVWCLLFIGRDCGSKKRCNATGEVDR